ncbi:MAG: hypothetical protein A2151_06715 [Candidatus Muproteobacteria bacterium RBG_16_65_34]|uniref:DUF5666 domain-containing protein n=1 Tax=Candidatus Muproteobacteria bacterium RBG_16_65_34 TaxID=1817760 RepID=A0A1F6TVY4_9PROT|nr:MAG: hypothetical protein A2151_06715 [Candidatus Muproteobacteria bacterium RBG_16_65_34]
MKLGILRNMALMGSALAVVVACGGGSGSGSGSGATAVSYGPITQFGSVYVNGVEYFTTTTSSVKEDGNEGPGEDEGAGESEHHRGLKLGMVVKVEGDHDGDGQGTATHIEYRNNLIGPAVVTGSQLTALGQIVNVTSSTVVANESGAATENLNTGVADALALISGRVIEVSGLVGVGGAIDATRIEMKAPGWTGAYEIKGTVAGLAVGTFQINGLTVAYSANSLENSLDLEHGATLANGQFVEVKGWSFNASTITLTATEVELVDDEGFGVTASAPKAEIEGLVTAVTSQGFTVGTQPVVTTSSTIYEHGDSAGIVQGARLEVEGTLSGGTLTATKISFKH